MRKLTYIGHSAFLIEKEWDGVLIDPFISGNPVAKFDYKTKRISHIIVTHAHSDHLGDAIEISKETGAQIIAVFELATYCMAKGAKATGVGIGGKLKFNWVCTAYKAPFNSTLSFSFEYAPVPKDLNQLFFLYECIKLFDIPC